MERSRWQIAFCAQFSIAAFNIIRKRSFLILALFSNMVVQFLVAASEILDEIGEKCANKFHENCFSRSFLRVHTVRTKQLISPFRVENRLNMTSTCWISYCVLKFLTVSLTLNLIRSSHILIYAFYYKSINCFLGSQ